MATVVESVRHRIDPTPLTALVAGVDLALIGAFVVAGELSHGVNPLASPAVVAETYLTFCVGWAVAALLGGLYTRDAWRSPKRAAAWTAPAWLAAAVVAQLVRATPVVHGNAALALYLVSSAVGLALLVPWRVTVAWLADRQL